MKIKIIFALILISSCYAINLRPVIGILTMPSTYDEYPSSKYSYFGASYVKYLESAGSIVVPIQYDLPKQEIDFLFKQINGFLFPGGGATLWANEAKKEGFSELMSTAKYIVDLAKKANNEGDYFPIWGTCLGFEELLIALTNNPKILGDFNHQNDSQNLIYVIKNPEEFAPLRYVSRDIIAFTKLNNVGYYAHHFGKSYQEYLKDKDLQKLIEVAAIGKDFDNQEFIAMMRSRYYPFYGTQFHPEVQVYEWREELNSNHEPQTIEFSHNLAFFFTQECRKSTHKFESAAIAQKYYIYNYNAVHPVPDFYEQVYFLKNVNTTINQQSYQKY